MTASRPYSPWVAYYNPDKAYNGYTLFTPSRYSVAWLIGMDGRPVHCWNMPYRPGAYGRLLENGNLLYAGQDPQGPYASMGGGASGGIMLEVDWDGKILWEYRDRWQHHDFFRMDNGNTMILGLYQVPPEIAAKVQGSHPSASRDGEMMADYFHEVTPEGKVVWEWYAHEHLDLDIDVMCLMDDRGQWTHANSCFVMPDGNILTTLHHLHSAAIIDKGTGAIKWRWGAARNENLGHPHDPTLLDNGNILIFDNGAHRRGRQFGDYSRVVEVNPQTREIVWEYRANPPTSFYSFFISGAQRLPNENTLICEGAWGRFFEVTAEKEVVWEYVNPFHTFRADFGTWWNSAFRAYRYSPDHPALKGKTLDPDRWELTLRERPLWKEELTQQRLGRLGY